MNKTQKYAEMVLKLGINIQEGQTLFVTSQIETAEFARLVMEEAYKLGAGHVHIQWMDDKSSRIQHLNNADSVYESFPMWRKEFYEHFDAKKTSYLHISASDPEALKGVDTSRLAKFSKLSEKYLQGHTNNMMNNKLRWCVVSVPSTAWAMKMYPGVEAQEAKEKLWDAIFNATRMNEDNPTRAWENHIENLTKKSEFLNKNNFKRVKITNSLGTDINVGLVENHHWQAASEYDPEGTRFVANLPTEEVYTMPSAKDVEGVVYSSKPLVFAGNIIDEFWLKFEKGIVVDYDAKVGKEVLKEMLSVDDGAKRLGEIALVPYDSPISLSNTLFYNTLFDENASCHFALGRAYGTNIKDGDVLTSEQKQAIGMNESAIHVDFMFGTKDLKVVGETASGEIVEIFNNGNFAF